METGADGDISEEPKCGEGPGDPQAAKPGVTLS